MEELGEEVRAVARDADRCIVKVLLTRGTSLARGYGITGRETATRITLRYAWPREDPAWAHDGVRVRIADLRLGENPMLAGLKHCNRLEQILAFNERKDRGISESLLFSSSGRLISGAMSNLFLVEGSQLRTPRLDLCGVAGIMRRMILGEAGRAGIA